MWRACLRFGMLCVLAACGGHRAQPTALDNHVEQGERDLTGGFWCSIKEGAFKYPPFPCAIREIDHRLVLAKLAGSQRFEGVVTPTADGFGFAGRFYCPFGDCTQPLHGVFRATGNGKLEGRFRDAKFLVELEPAPASAFGGASYGGDEYGGFGYGGASYGGTPRNIDRNRDSNRRR